MYPNFFVTYVLDSYTALRWACARVTTPRFCVSLRNNSVPSCFSATYHCCVVANSS